MEQQLGDRFKVKLGLWLGLKIKLRVKFRRRLQLRLRPWLRLRFSLSLQQRPPPSEASASVNETARRESLSQRARTPSGAGYEAMRRKGAVPCSRHNEVPVVWPKLKTYHLYHGMYA